MIPIEYTGEVRRSCLIEEIVQSLGLPNDSFNVSPSIFNDSEDYKELTDQDILFLRILYSNNIVSGKYYEYNKNSIFKVIRSEEHTSELQSLMRISYAVFCLKKKTKNTILN